MKILEKDANRSEQELTARFVLGFGTRDGSRIPVVGATVGGPDTGLIFAPVPFEVAGETWAGMPVARIPELGTLTEGGFIPLWTTLTSGVLICEDRWVSGTLIRLEGTTGDPFVT
ncbi:unnamed protein product [Echinostoma caproni]|uniref:Hydrogenase maturation protease n=1 Tax=Echinostoma caproni TaxID=27848 RepID=A0A183A4L2_9TREM|nr:unnamed protein product [Echinostoma caproni]